ncbi:MAG: CDP-alcohol phosphatidyltransferase family protein [Spirochaetota bacterium]|nr:CDP-alcohol phosphatidyltransferase family protein [Spirochaetota bacterium]
MINNEILISLLPLIIVNSSVIAALIIFAFLYPKRPNDPEVLGRMHKSFIGVFIREFWYWVVNPFISIFKALGLTPNMLTGISLVFALISGYFYYRGDFALAGWVLIICGTMDLLDGRLARVTQQVSREGAFYDSCIDRYSDGIVLIGIALYFRDDFCMLTVSLFALLGSELVSYAKARGEAIGVTTERGIMQRPERVASLSIVSVIYPFLKIVLSNYGIRAEYPMMIIIFLMAVLTNYTAIVRIVEIFKKIKNLENHDG